LEYGNLQAGCCLSEKIANKAKCRVVGTEPNLRRLLGAAQTEIFYTADAKRMSREHFLIRQNNERNKFIVSKNMGKVSGCSLSIMRFAKRLFIGDRFHRHDYQLNNANGRRAK
jgi:hypothetical protein